MPVAPTGGPQLPTTNIFKDNPEETAGGFFFAGAATVAAFFTYASMVSKEFVYHAVDRSDYPDWDSYMAADTKAFDDHMAKWDILNAKLGNAAIITGVALCIICAVYDLVTCTPLFDRKQDTVLDTVKKALDGVKLPESDSTAFTTLKDRIISTFQTEENYTVKMALAYAESCRDLARGEAKVEEINAAEALCRALQDLIEE